MISSTVLVAALLISASEEPMTPEAIIDKHFEGKATVEFVAIDVGVYRTNVVPTSHSSDAIWFETKPGKGDEKFYVELSREVATRLKRLGIDDLRTHFRGKMVRVTGKVQRKLVGTQPVYHIEVCSLDQVERVWKPK